MVNLKPLTAHLNHPKALKSAVLCSALLLVVSVLRISHYNAIPEVVYSTDTLPIQTSSDVRFPPRIANYERMHEITENNTDLVYLPAPNLVFMTLGKGGTTSTWYWLYKGLAGRNYDRTGCETYVQNQDGPCWEGHAVYVDKLPEHEQWRVLTSYETIRVAIQRNPFERIVSCFKSKFTCEDEVFGTDVGNRDTMVPTLRRQAGLPVGAPCMNISEFAEALNGARRKAGTPGHRLTSLRKMDVHIRPQEFFFDEIDYDLVLDVRDLDKVEYLQPIINRLKYKDLVKKGIQRRHASTGSKLRISEDAAKLLHLFALESKPGKRKFYTSKQ